MENLRVIRWTLLAAAASVALMFFDLRDGLIFFVIMVALAVAKWAEWKFWPRLRWRIRPRRVR